jgi:hypothetical protein
MFSSLVTTKVLIEKRSKLSQIHLAQVIEIQVLDKIRRLLGYVADIQVGQGHRLEFINRRLH